MRPLSLALLLTACGPAPVTGVDDDPATSCTEGLEPGDCAPEFTLSSTEGASVTLSQLGGKRVIVIGTSNW